MWLALSVVISCNLRRRLQFDMVSLSMFDVAGALWEVGNRLKLWRIVFIFLSLSTQCRVAVRYPRLKRDHQASVLMLTFSNMSLIRYFTFLSTSLHIFIIFWLTVAWHGTSRWLFKTTDHLLKLSILHDVEGGPTSTINRQRAVNKSYCNCSFGTLIWLLVYSAPALFSCVWFSSRRYPWCFWWDRNVDVDEQILKDTVQFLIAH